MTLQSTFPKLKKTISILVFELRNGLLCAASPSPSEGGDVLIAYSLKRLKVCK